MSDHTTPELIKHARRAMQNDPESISGELVRAWDALLAENQRWEKRAWNAERRKAAVEAEIQRLRDALERIADDRQRGFVHDSSVLVRKHASAALAAVREKNERPPP